MDQTETSGARPRVVLITGEPGSGKTTLGTDLARALRVPFLARDDVRGGLFFTGGAWKDGPASVPRAGAAVDAFLTVVETMAGQGVSCVVEYVVRDARPHDLERLEAAADCVVLCTWCSDPAGRLAEREREDPLLRRPAVREALGYASHEARASEVAERMRLVAHEMRTEFDLPLLGVNTDEGYEPELDRVIAFVARE